MLAEFLLLTVVHQVETAPTAVADKIPYESAEQSAKLYQESDARTVKGIITDTRTIKMNDDAEFIQMDVETNQGTIPVHLGPAWYMEEYADRFDVDKGRSVLVVGSVATVEGKEVLVAAEVSTDDGRQHMRIRHPGGTPAWVGGEHHK